MSKLPTQLITDELLLEIQHIVNVLEERILLYAKRRVETKRAIKSMARARIIPKHSTAFVMLEADLSYMINVAGLNGLKSIAQLIKERKDLKSTSIDDIFEGNNQFKKSFVKELLSFREINSTQASIDDLETLIIIVYSLDENLQRKTISNFLRKYGSNLLKEIFNDLIVFDNHYIKSTIDELTDYLGE